MRVVLLALLCAACFVHAALPGDGSCAPAGAAWAPVTDADLPEPVVGALLNALFSSSVANATALEACPPDALDLTAAGCALVRPPSPRVVAGTKYELLINATCGGVPLEGVLARVFAPLPSANEPVSVDLEVLAAAAGLGAAAATSATAGAATSSGGTPSFVRSEDLDYYGGELPDQQPDQQWWNCGLDSPDACEDLCANRTDCLTYSWVPVHPRCEGPTCYLKGDATAVTCLRAAPGVVSGRREPVTGDAPSCAVKVPNLIVSGCWRVCVCMRAACVGVCLRVGGATEHCPRTHHMPSSACSLLHPEHVPSPRVPALNPTLPPGRLHLHNPARHGAGGRRPACGRHQDRRQHGWLLPHLHRDGWLQGLRLHKRRRRLRLGRRLWLLPGQHHRRHRRRGVSAA